MKSYKIVTLGCKVNSYESSSLESKLKENGYIKDENNPSYIFLNTCAVTAHAEKQDRQTLRRLIRTYPNSKIIVLGCSSQVNKEDYLSYKNVIKVRGSENKTEISDLDKGIIDDVNPSFRSFTYSKEFINESTYKSKAYLKIQDGCDNFCSYCIVPYARGRSRYKNKDDVLNEFKMYVNMSIKEIIIGGIDVGSYNVNGYRLKDLLKDLIKIEGDFRIRVSSIEISQIDEEYISLFKNDKLASHFHIPLQSGSSKILKLMNRKYSKEEYLNKVNLIRSILDNVALSTDLITGFPQESEEDFLDSIDVIKKANFMKVHVFPYSERKNTKAILLDGKIDPSIKNKRVRIVEELSDSQQKNYFNQFKNDNVQILIEKVVDDKVFGYTSNYLYVSTLNNNYKVGQLVNVKPVDLIIK